MAFAKLWNAFFGKRAATTLENVVTELGGESKKGLDQRQASGPSLAASTIQSPTASIKLSRRKAKTPTAKSQGPIAPVVPAEAAPVLRMFRRKHNSWSKLIGTRTPRTILDIHVGDGTRAVEVLESLVDSEGLPPKYIAIGMFEQGDEPLTVRQFHQKVRSAGGNAMVIPMPLIAGLRRLSQTVGTVDLLIVDGHETLIHDAETVRWLQRVISADSLVVKRDTAGRWQSTATPLRKAA